MLDRLAISKREWLLKQVRDAKPERVALNLRPIVAADRSRRLPLSFAQQRLWFLAQMEGVSEAYHIPFRVRLKGQLKRTALRAALNRIVARHEALRTTFGFIDGEPVQQIGAAEDCRFELAERHLSASQQREAKLKELAGQRSGARIDWE